MRARVSYRSLIAYVAGLIGQSVHFYGHIVLRHLGHFCEVSRQVQREVDAQKCKSSHVCPTQGFYLACGTSFGLSRKNATSRSSSSNTLSAQTVCRSSFHFSKLCVPPPPVGFLSSAPCPICPALQSTLPLALASSGSLRLMVSPPLVLCTQKQESLPLPLTAVVGEFPGPPSSSYEGRMSVAPAHVCLPFAADLDLLKKYQRDPPSSMYYYGNSDLLGWYHRIDSRTTSRLNLPRAPKDPFGAGQQERQPVFDSRCG